MLESGIVSLKNEVNIMMKNVVDVVLGGVTYWAFGYGLSYGSGEALIIACGAASRRPTSRFSSPSSSSAKFEKFEN